MRLYEGLFIFPPDAPDAQKNQLKAVEDLIAKFGGQVAQKTEWGKRPLGYPVRKFHEGHCVLLEMQMDPARAPEFRKALELQEDLIKFMVTRKEEKREKKRPASAAKPKPETKAAQPAAHPS